MTVAARAMKALQLPSVLHKRPSATMTSRPATPVAEVCRSINGPSPDMWSSPLCNTPRKNCQLAPALQAGQYPVPSIWLPRSFLPPIRKSSPNRVLKKCCPHRLPDRKAGNSSACARLMHPGRGHRPCRSAKAEPTPAGGQSPQPAPAPPLAGASHPPGRALACRVPGPAGLRGTVPPKGAVPFPGSGGFFRHAGDRNFSAPCPHDRSRALV
jgi:hypothetical protein